MLELIISMIILAIALGGLIGLFVLGKGWVFHSQAKIAAAELGRRFLDPLQMDVRQDQWDPASNCLSRDGSVGCPGQETVGLVQYTPVYTIDNVGLGGNSDLRRVVVTISWNEPS